jgi:transcriptional regulator with XRE-family HTH domain
MSCCTEALPGRQNGAAIRVIRKLSGMSPAALAEAAGIAEQSLRNIENDSRPASIPVITAIAVALKVPTEAITRTGLPLAA